MEEKAAIVVLRPTRWSIVLTMHRRSLLCKARHEAVPMMRFASSGNMSLQRDRVAESGVDGCALAVAAHRRSKMQQQRCEAEREEGARGAWP